MVDSCPERMDAANAEAPRIETEEATMLSLETAVDICPERMDAADAEAPRIETAVEF